MEDYDIPEELINKKVVIAYNELIQVAQNQPPDFIQFEGTIKENLKGSIRCEVLLPDKTQLDMTIPKARIRFIGKKMNTLAPSPGEISKFSLKH